ncbi:MAG TPA: NAD(P)-dependent oxidoreductase [Armatimonadota bacterium]|nr:NAD(P)-dependent oxidoreductase [Armatimonadota bacterium]
MKTYTPLKLLVTGSEGHIGKAQVAEFVAAGHEVRTMDRQPASDPGDRDHRVGDLRDRSVVREAVRGMDAVAHLGAIAGDWEGHDEEVMQINVMGSWNVLQSCLEEGIRRVVSFSSVQALGNFMGFREADYLPIDDFCPRHPMSAYQLSKHLGEETCRSFSERHGIVTICIRPVGVVQPGAYTRRNSSPDPARGKMGYWSYVDVRDVCEATIRALTAENILHDSFLVAADDSHSVMPTAELVERCCAHTPWPGVSRDDYFVDNPYRSLVDCAHAKQALGWRPRHSWRDEEVNG